MDELSSVESESFESSEDLLLDCCGELRATMLGEESDVVDDGEGSGGVGSEEVGKVRGGGVAGESFREVGGDGATFCSRGSPRVGGEGKELVDGSVIVVVVFES